MQFEFFVQDAEGDLAQLREYLEGAQCAHIALSKRDRSAMSVHDTISFMAQSPEALVAVAAGIGALLASLGHRARIKITADGTVIGENLSSKQAARIVEAATRKP